jgi:hypothetical protein
MPTAKKTGEVSGSKACSRDDVRGKMNVKRAYIVIFSILVMFCESVCGHWEELGMGRRQLNSIWSSTSLALTMRTGGWSLPTEARKLREGDGGVQMLKVVKIKGGLKNGKKTLAGSMCQARTRLRIERNMCID